MIIMRLFTKLLTLIFVKGVIYMILRIWQAFRLSGTTFVRKCVHEIWLCLQACLLWTQSACGSHIHSSDKTWKNGTYDLLYKNPYFFVTTWA